MSASAFDADLLVNRFTWVDYCVFGAMLAASAAIGIYYGCVAKKMEDTKDFLMAGKSMSAFPVAMSLIASFISAISLLGTPSEVYQTGITYWLILLAYMTAIPLSGYVFLPVFWELQLTSSFEYLELRFNKSVRRLGSVLFIIVTNLYMAFVIYAPALALAQVTGLNVFLSVSLITFVSMFYTAIGGMKAVLWTDALQMVIMFGGIILVVTKGTIDLGGLQRIWEVSSLGNRTVAFDFNPDPRVRHTVWGLGIGQFFYWFSVFGVNQTQVQRYLCVSKLSTARKLLWMSGIGFVIIVGLSCLIGLIVYTKYVACDPISSNIVERPDQLVPLFVMDHFGHWKGFPGIFIAGIFSGALSTVSSGINSLTAITLEDFLKAICCTNISEKKATLYAKFMSIGYGIIAFLLVILASQLGDVLSTTNTVTGMVHGPLLALFTLGMLIPVANSLGAFLGTIAGLLVTGWIVFGQQIGVRNKVIALGKLPVNVCDNFTVYDNLTNDEIMESFSLYQTPSEILIPTAESDSILTEIYRVSYVWSTMFGFLSAIIVGVVVSLLTKAHDIRKIDPKLMSPAVFWLKGIFPGVLNIGIDFRNEDQQDSIEKKNNEIYEAETNHTDTRL